jgi:site-specific DNA-methyltransferase (cytosine-N4-specific)
MIPFQPIDDVQADWTFRTADTRYFSHRYHDYPARMIPQIADRLLREYGQSAQTLFDPYCGSGTTLVEGMLHGIETYGTDLNPLARLLAKTKTAYIELSKLDTSIREFLELCMHVRKDSLELPPWLDHQRVAFWFKPEVAQRLLEIYSFISHIEDSSVENFFLTAFSETIRDCSNTRGGEFKLFRKAPEELERFRPNVFEIMITKLGRNRVAYGEMHGFMGAKDNWKPAHVFDFNSVHAVPRSALEPFSIDIVITSPPYGDSHTTVAYGQFSRLSSDWLGFTEASKVDSMLMGGKRCKVMPHFAESYLDKALDSVADHDRPRALEAAAFYKDLRDSINNVAGVIKPGGFACYVVANRRIKGIDLPTDRAVVHFFEEAGFTYVATHRREIPNKRMPLRNSPSNEAGATDTTMVREIVVVMQKL